MSRALAYDAPLTHGEIATATVLPTRTASYALSRVQDAGIIEAVPCPSDPRKNDYRPLPIQNPHGSGDCDDTEDVRRVDNLSEGQRDAFELARQRGYYEWPRNVSTRELADEMDVSKTTFLEHLRKAESKLLDP